MSVSRFDLTGKIALVTGCARGIGQAIAIALGEHGADVILVDRAEKEVTQKTADKINALGRRTWIYEHDLSKTETLSGLIDQAWKEAGHIDILVNNAGIAFLEHFNQISLEHWRLIMAVNLDAPFFLAQRAAERMVHAGIKGRIINISSVNGLVAEPGLAHYNTSKGGLEMMTKSLATELGPMGITVNTLAPGGVRTEIGSEFKVDPEFWAYIKSHIPLENRFADPAEIAAGVVFLASPGASYMTGHHLVIDGGVHAQQRPRLQFMPPFEAKVD